MFVVFEGIDGTGKGLQVQRAVEYLRGRLGHDLVIQTKDPGGTKLGLSIRRVMYEEVPTTQMAPGVVDLLFLASHLQNWLTVVGPALKFGKSVVSDRWWYSQAAYMTQRFVPNPIADAYMSCRGASAELFVFLHGDVETVLNRARSRESETHQSAKDWNDQEVLDRIQRKYFELFSTCSEWYPVCINGKTPDEVWSLIQPGIDRLLESRKHA